MQPCVCPSCSLLCPLSTRGPCTAASWKTQISAKQWEHSSTALPSSSTWDLTRLAAMIFSTSTKLRMT